MIYRRMMQAAAVAAVLLLCAASAIAADKTNKANLTVLTPVTVNGITLAPGDYQVRWEGTGQIRVSVSQGKKVFATVPATIQPRSTNYDSTVLLTTRKGDVIEIRPEGRKEALVLDVTPAQQ